jgi:hypothetical protein
MTEIQDLEPADFTNADYRQVLRRLTTLDDEAATLRAEAVSWHDERVNAAQEAVHAAEDDLEDATHALVAAQRDREEVDARANGLWSEFVHKVGPIAERYGRTLPAATVPRQRSERDAGDYLDEVQKRVAYTPPARPLNTPVKFLFGVFGFVGGVVGVILNQVLRNTAAQGSHNWQHAVPVVALVVMLACPVLAVVAAKRVADRRGVGLTFGIVSTVIVTGLITAALLLAALRA